MPEELDAEQVGSIAALPWSSPEEGLVAPWPGEGDDGSCRVGDECQSL